MRRRRTSRPVQHQADDGHGAAPNHPPASRPNDERRSQQREPASRVSAGGIGMTDTAQYTSPYTGRPISEWIDPIRLVDVEGDNVGEIVEVNPDFVVVKEGHWLAEDEYYYVPRGQVTEGSDSWSLTVDKDDLEKNYSGQWAQPPQDSAWSQDTYRSGQPIDSYATG